ncbi:hypothetical protein [Nocardioides sp.]|uniref:baeRF3 domain-containing protein n=1 Tax=Nocardioides sp. TaxID=35761 RepID=UPI003784ACC8
MDGQLTHRTPASGADEARDRRRRTVPPTVGGVLVLQSMRSYPSVSILANTTPGETVGATTLARLRRHCEQAERRLRDEGVANAEITSSLAALVERAGDLEADRSIALFASGSHSDLMTLPVEVVERVVVDPTFATRDLVRALHRTPRHLVLLLSAKQARLFIGQGRRMSPAHGSKFPLVDSSEKPGGADRFLRRVDAALGAYLRVTTGPLVVVAAEPTASSFTAASRNVGRLAGVVPGHHLRASLDQIADLARPVVESYLRSRQEEALALLDTRLGQGRAALGIDAAWLAARWEPVEMLAVDHTYFYPARLSEDGDHLEPATDIEHPDVIDDAVDEVVEQVLLRRGWVALVEPGSLPGGERIAVTLSRR